MLLLGWGLNLGLLLRACLSKSLTNLLVKELILWSTVCSNWNRYMLRNNTEELFLCVTQVVLIFKPSSNLVCLIYFANVLVSFNKLSERIMELSETDLSLARFIPLLREVLDKFSPYLGFLNDRNRLRFTSDLEEGVAYHIWQVRHKPVIQVSLV